MHTSTQNVFFLHFFSIFYTSRLPSICATLFPFSSIQGSVEIQQKKEESSGQVKFVSDGIETKGSMRQIWQKRGKKMYIG